MNAKLITSWTEHDEAVKNILEMAIRKICIFDEDLAKLKLEEKGNAELLQRFLATNRKNSLQIVLKNTDPLQRNSPRLMALLRQYTPAMQVVECSPGLENLNDSLFIADDCHALIRFHKDNVRCKSVIDDARECTPYVKRFEEILKAGEATVGITTLGL